MVCQDKENDRVYLTEEEKRDGLEVDVEIVEVVEFVNSSTYSQIIQRSERFRRAEEIKKKRELKAIENLEAGEEKIETPESKIVDPEDMELTIHDIMAIHPGRIRISGYSGPAISDRVPIQSTPATPATPTGNNSEDIVQGTGSIHNIFAQLEEQFY
jgi:hypothetical protein